MQKVSLIEFNYLSIVCFSFLSYLTINYKIVDGWMDSHPHITLNEYDVDIRKKGRKRIASQ